MEDFVALENKTSLPTIHVLSDSVGITATGVARAAAVQFGVQEPCIETISKVRSMDEIVPFFEEHAKWHEERTGSPRMLVFFTLVDPKLAKAFSQYAEENPNITAVDVLTPAIEAIESFTGFCPSNSSGMLHSVDRSYMKRIDADEFTIEHDDGRNPQDLTRADIVLLGVSRSSKTPLSIYLSQQGYRVANVPIDSQTTPPKEIYSVDTTRLFGLMTTPDVLVDIRTRRLGKARAVASAYADPEHVYKELEDARKLMRRLGCIVVHTERRAVEETAQEIIRYYERYHPVWEQGIEL